MTQPASGFECAGADYDHALARGISVSGEDWAYFALGRIRHLRACLGTLGGAPRLLGVEIHQRHGGDRIVDERRERPDGSRIPLRRRRFRLIV